MKVSEFKKNRFLNNGNLAICAVFEEYPEEYEVVTVNLHEVPMNQAYVDINNYPSIVSDIVAAGIGKPTGKTCRSGFVTYPLYEFNVDEIGEL